MSSRWLISGLSNVLFQTAWATVIHVGHENGGMKLRDLARSSSNPTSFMPAFHTLWSRFGNRGTARCSRKLYESVPGSSSAPRLLTLLQQTTVVPVLGALHPPRHPGSAVTFPIRTHHGDRNLCPRACHRPASSYFLMFEQNQDKVYHEVLIAGDLSKEDVVQAYNLSSNFLQHGGRVFDTAEFVYGNETIYFAQPSLSQFVPGGSGAGNFDPALIAPAGSQNNALALTGRNAPKNTETVLQDVPPTC